MRQYYPYRNFNLWCYLILLLHRVFSWISQFYFHLSRWFVVWKGQELAYNMRHLLQVLWSDLVIIFYHMSFVTTIFIPSAHLSCLPFYSRWVDSWSISVPWCFLSVINFWYLFSFVLYSVVQLADSLIEVTTIAWNTFSLNGRVKHLSRDFFYFILISNRDLLISKKRYPSIQGLYKGL